VLIGNIGKDIEMRATQSGKTVGGFSLATSEKKGQTDWHNITVWEPLDWIQAGCVKGAKIAVEGRISYRSWDDKQGNKRYATDIVAYRIELLDKRPDSGQNRGGDDEPPMPTDEW